MTSMYCEGSQIHDGVRDSKIRWDTPSKPYQKLDSFTSEANRDLDRLRHHLNYDHHRVRQDVPRTTKDGVAAGFHLQSYSITETPSFEDNMSWFHGFKEIEDPFYWFCDKHSGSDSLIGRFKRNIFAFDGFWHTQDLMIWIEAIEDFFEEISPPEHLKCTIVWYKMKGAAYYWWKQLQRDRIICGKEEITSWTLMKNLLLNRFSPAKCLTECPNHDKRDELYCSMSSTEIPTTVTHEKPIGEAVNYVSPGAHNFQQQSVVQLDAPKQKLKSFQYGYDKSNGTEVECISTKQHVMPWGSIEEFEAAHAKDLITQDTIPEFDGINEDSEDIKRTVAVVEGCERDDDQIINEEEDSDSGCSKENKEESIKVPPVASRFPTSETSIREKPFMMVLQDEYGIGAQQTNAKHIRKKTLSSYLCLTNGHLAGYGSV